MAPRRNKLRVHLTGAFTLAAARVLGVLPLPWAYGITRTVARFAARTIPRVRQVTRDNLDLAYGDSLTPQEKQQILMEAVDNVAIVAAEFARIPQLRDGALLRMINVEGTEHIDRSRGGFMIGAHLANWEWMAPVTAAQGFKVAEVVRPLDSPALNRYIDATRCSTGVVTIPKEGAGPEVIRLLKEGYIVGVLVDQQPRDNAAPVTFFDQPCWGTIAPVMAAVRAKVPIYPASMVRNADGHYTLRFHPPLELQRTQDFRADLVANCQHCQDVIEKLVRAHPGQWLWLHRRWKRRDRLEQEWERRAAKQTRNAKTSDAT